MGRIVPHGKLGKLSPGQDPRTLRLAKYLTPDLPPPPDTLAPPEVSNWMMFLNDQVGDCTIAAAAHLIMAWTKVSKGTAQVLPDSVVISSYSAVSGYDPKTGSNDDGAVEDNVLKFWAKSGLGGDKLGAWVDTDLGDIQQVKVCSYLFHGLYIGVALPLSAQGKSEWKVPWYGTLGNGKPGSWGGHAVCVVGYNSTGPIVVTWGQLLQMSWSFWRTYCDESHAIISQDYLLGSNKTPEGLDWASLSEDLAKVRA